MKGGGGECKVFSLSTLGLRELDNWCYEASADFQYRGSVWTGDAFQGSEGRWEGEGEVVPAGVLRKYKALLKLLH